MSYPLFFTAISAGIGIAVARYTYPAGWLLWLSVGLVLTVGVTGAGTLRRAQTRFLRAGLVVILCLASFTLGVWGWYAHQQSFRSTFTSETAFDGLVETHGLLRRRPGGGWQWEGRIADATQTHLVGLRVIVFTDLIDEEVHGHRHRVRGTLVHPEGPRNPAGFDYPWYLERRGIEYVIWADEVSLESHMFWHRGIMRLRDRISLFSSPYVAGLVQALSIGSRTEVPQDLQEQLRRTGLGHLLAISGLHILFLGMMMWTLLHRLVPARLATGLSLLFIAGFVVLLGAPPSTTRAAWMFAGGVMARELNRPTEGLNLIGLAASILLLQHPPVLFDVGFQLSFGAVLALATVYPAICERLQGQMPMGVARAFASSLAITVGVYPLSLLHFGEVPIIGLMLNLLVVPVLPVLLFSAWSSALWIMVFGANSVVVGCLASPLAAFVHLIQSMGKVPTLQLTPPNPLQYLFLLCLLGIPLIAGACKGQLGRHRLLRPTRHIRSRSTSTGIGVILCIFVITTWYALPAYAPLLRVTVFDVGQGDCILVETPTGTRWLIDTGPPHWQGGTWLDREVIPYLEREGIEFIDFLVLTHGHLDHVGGLDDLLRAVEVGEMRIGPMGDHHELDERIDEAQPLFAGEQWVVDGVEVAVIWATVDQTHGLDLNEASVAIRVTFEQWSMVLMADVERVGERRMLESPFRDSLPATVLKVGHHGSAYASSSEFLKVVRPEVSVISVGRNPYGHPAPQTLRRLDA